MEKLVFKNTYLNTIFGALLIILAILGYFLNWFEDYLPYVIAAVLILLSAKRFLFTFRKITSKNATLILVLELLLDLVFAGLLIYLQDHVAIFMGLIIYVRGVSYLLINYIATRKIKLLQYVFNIGYVTLGAFLLFTGIDLDSILVLGLSILVLLIGAIYLQAGVVELVKKEAKEDAVKKEQKEQVKQFKEIQKAEQKDNEKIEKHKEKIDELQEKVKSVEEKQKKVEQDNKELQKKVAATEKPKEKQIAYDTLTVVELKAIAKERKLTGYSQLTKAELIKLLKTTK